MWIRRGVYLFLGAAGLVLALVLGIFLVDQSVYTDYIKQVAITQARSQGVTLSYKKSELGFRSFVARDVDIFIPSSFLMVHAQEITLAPHLGSLFKLSPRVSVKAKAYDGEINAEFVFSRELGLSPLSLKVERVNLGKHPQIEGLGFRSGILDISIPSIQARGFEDAVFAGTFSLSQADKPGSTLLPARLLKLPFDVTVPEILNLNFVFEFDSQPSLITLNKIATSSSLATGSGRLLYQRENFSPAKNVEGEFKFVLSEEGVKFAGPVVALLSQGALDSTAKAFRVSLHGNPSFPTARWWKVPAE
jgi:hypothetical protein